MSLRSLRLFVVGFLSCVGVTFGVMSVAFADLNGGACNRAAYCFNWYHDPALGWQCKNVAGQVVYPTDAGCVSTVCGPCEQSVCLINMQAGKSCECRTGYPGGAVCKTCLLVDPAGNVIASGCINNGCSVYLYDCEVGYPGPGGSGGPGNAKCQCK